MLDSSSFWSFNLVTNLPVISLGVLSGQDKFHYCTLTSVVPLGPHEVGKERNQNMLVVTVKRAHPMLSTI